MCQFKRIHQRWKCHCTYSEVWVGGGEGDPKGQDGNGTRLTGLISYIGVGAHRERGMDEMGVWAGISTLR